MPLRVKCPNPNCGQVHRVPDEWSGRGLRCAACDTRFSVAQLASGVSPPGSGGKVPVPASAALPEHIDRYQVRAKLGAGAFGTVYRAFDPNLEREVALKVLRPEALDSPEEVERFRREARAVAKLKHPHIVAVYDCGQDGTQHFIAYELIEGQTLVSAIGRGTDPRRAARLVAELAEALAYAHAHGILHRDVKPANVMLDQDDQALLVDFGLARHGTGMTRTGMILGTPQYMSPEQLQPNSVQIGPASDLYSLGVTLYHLLTGAAPFQGPLEAVIAQILFQQPDSPRLRRPELDPRLEAICLKAMTKEPAQRYRTGTALAAALRGWLAGQAEPPAAPAYSRDLAVPTPETDIVPPPVQSTMKEAVPPALASAGHPSHGSDVYDIPERPQGQPRSATLKKQTPQRPAVPGRKAPWRAITLGIGALLLAGMAPLVGLTLWHNQKAQEQDSTAEEEKPKKPATPVVQEKVEPKQPARPAAFGPGHPHVVLIGISKYADKQIKPRLHAEDDVKALYDLFTSKDHLGADPDHVQLLLGSADRRRPSLPATRENILATLRRVVATARRDDLVVLALMVQGAPLGARGEQTCYLSMDSTLAGRATDALAAEDIAETLESLKSRHVAVFLDVNFKGVDAGKDTSIPEASLGEAPYREFLSDDKTEDHNPLPGRVIFMATNGLSASPDLKEHGLFTTALLSGLQGEADKEGYEPDGVVTVDELTTYLNKKIPELKRKQTKKNDTAHFILSGKSSHFVLTTNPRAITRARQRLDKFDKMVKAGDLDKETAEEGQRLLERMPKLQALRDLRKEYQKLVDGGLTVQQLAVARALVLATMRLPDAEAHRFTSTVVAGLKRVREEAVQDLNRGELIVWAIRGLYWHVDEAVPEDLADRLGRVKILSDPEQDKLLQEARTRLGKREDLDKHKDIDVALQRCLARIDPYTVYIDPEMKARSETDTSAEFTGIGAQVRKDNATDMLLVVTPIKGSPSYRLGLLAGDLISTITREVDSEGNVLNPPEVLSTKDLTLNEAVKKLLGKPGTKVKITVQREGTDRPLDFEITRARVEKETVLGVRRKADDSWDYWLDNQNKIACVRMSQFGLHTTAHLTQAVRELRQQGMQGLVLDLRFNGGGLLSGAIAVSDLFIDAGLIVSLRNPRRGQEDQKTGQSAGSELDFKMVVLVNGSSASASEIVAACLQDHKRAVIVGERTFGKGCVQNQFDFDGGKIHVTAQTFWRPNGKNIHKPSTGGKEDEDWGVQPDSGYVLKLPRKERDDLSEHLLQAEIIPRRDRPAREKKEFKDRQLDLALNYLRAVVKTSR
jgi:C-terminal peptidase prc